MGRAYGERQGVEVNRLKPGSRREQELQGRPPRPEVTGLCSENDYRCIKERAT